MAKKAANKPRPKTEPIKTRVMIVDDHPIVRRGLAETIRQESDLEVCCEAEDARAAIAAIREGKPDVAVVDLTLKDIGGLELIKQIRAIDEDVIMLVLSMHDESLYAERCLRAGAKGYIMKQEGSERLVTALRTVLAGQVYLSEKMSARLLGKMVGGGTSAGASPLEALSDRELEVFELLGRGLGTRNIAERLCVSIKTVESHREHIKQKLNIKNATELVQHATQWVMSEGGG
ncbi:MAG: response regulator [Phycisphaera sp.]|nr:response regulator [Phycisphaera sp.]